jgi:hypothetical protein
MSKNSRMQLRVCLGMIVAFFLWGITAAEDGGWTVGPRKIPPPLGTSNQLRQSIAAMPLPTKSPCS